MKGDDVLFSSSNENWGTPRYVFDLMDKRFHFELDAAAAEDNTMCERFISKELNAFEQDWHALSGGQPVWLNPPYGKNMTTAWCEKALFESRKGCDVVLLIPARTETVFFQDVCFPHGQIWFLRTRIKFILEGKSNGAPFPSMFVHFGPDAQVECCSTIDLREVADAYQKEVAARVLTAAG